MGLPKLKVPSTVFAVQQSAEKENVWQLYIYDDITKYGEFNWETWEYEDSETSANHIREVLQEIPEGAELEIHINSNGGDAFEAVAIYNLLCQYKGHKTSYVDGVAHSAAFLIPFACDWRIMGRGTSALFHEMWTGARGNAEQFRQIANQLDNMMQSNRQIYLQRAKNITEEEIKELMAAETVLTPEMCLEYGFCDEIAGYEARQQGQVEGIRQMAEQMEEYNSQIARYRQLVSQLKKPSEQPKEPEPPKEEPITKQNECKEMVLQFASTFLNATTGGKE